MRFAPIVLLLFLSACVSAPKITGTAPTDFYLTDQNGKVWETQKLKEGTLLIDFWATWCVPCLQSIPDLNAFHEKYGTKIKLLGIAIEEKGWDTLTPAALKHNIEYPITVGHASLARAYAVEGFPYLVLIHKGKIERQLLGKHNLKQLEAELAPYLK